LLDVANESYLREFLGCSKLLEKYELAEKLGEGTFGIVWKGRIKKSSPSHLMHTDRKKVEEVCITASGRHMRNGLALIKRHQDGAIRRKVGKPGDIVALKRIILHQERDGVRFFGTDYVKSH